MNEECYFTAENIELKSRGMLAELQGFRIQHRQSLDLKHSALLVIDMQRYFVDESSDAFIPASRAIIPRIAELVEFYTRSGSPIIFTRHLNADDNAGMMSAWWHGDLIREIDPLSEITSELDLTQGLVIRKSRYDAFLNTSLEEILRRQNINQIVITGVMTNLCCETTARSAFTRGFEVFFTIDGTAANNESFHSATLLNLAYGFAVPVLIEEIVSGSIARSK